MRDDPLSMGSSERCRYLLSPFETRDCLTLGLSYTLTLSHCENFTKSCESFTTKSRVGTVGTQARRAPKAGTHFLAPTHSFSIFAATAFVVSEMRRPSLLGGRERVQCSPPNPKRHTRGINGCISPAGPFPKPSPSAPARRVKDEAPGKRTTA